MKTDGAVAVIWWKVSEIGIAEVGRRGKADCGGVENAPVGKFLFPPQPNRFTLRDTTLGINVKYPGSFDIHGGIITTGVGRSKNSNWDASAARAKTTAVTNLRVVRQVISR